MFDLTELLCSDCIVLDVDDSIDKAAKLMVSNQRTSLPIVDRDMRLIGLITERGVLDWLCNGRDRESSIKKCMITNVKTIEINSGLIAVVYKIIRERLRESLVVSNGRFIGVLKRHDAIQHLLELKNYKLKIMS